MKKYITLLLVLTLCGCLTTRIRNEPISPDLFRLASLRPDNLVIDIDTSQVKPLVGRQFVFLFLPFGKIEFDHFHTYFWRHLFQAFTLAGYRPIKADSPLAKGSKRLRIQVTNYSSHAYDLLFIRRLVTSVDLNATLYQETKPPYEWSGRASNSSWERKAFRAELEKSANKTLNQAMDDLVSFVTRDAR